MEIMGQLPIDHWMFPFVKLVSLVCSQSLLRCKLFRQHQSGIEILEKNRWNKRFSIASLSMRVLQHTHPSEGQVD